MSDLILKEFEGTTIQLRADGHVCLTDMARATGKKYTDWYRLVSTQELISVVSQNSGNPHDKLITSKQSTGTYGHPKIAIAFAMWCSPEFFYQVIEWTEEILLNGVAARKDVSHEQLDDFYIKMKETLAYERREYKYLDEENKQTIEAANKLIKENRQLKLGIFQLCGNNTSKAEKIIKGQWKAKNAHLDFDPDEDA